MKKERTVTLRDKNGKIFYGWVIVFMCLLNTTFVYATGISCAGTFMLPVTESLGFGMGEFGLYITIMSFAGLGALLVLQNKMTEKNLKRIMIISGILTGISFLGFAFSTEIWQFYLLSIPMGIGFMCMTITPSEILVANWFGSKARAFALSIATLGPSVGALLLINVLNQIVYKIGWNYGYIAIAIGIICIAVPATMILYVWSPEQKNTERMGVDTENTVEVNQSGMTFREAAKGPKVWIFLFSATIITLASSSFLTQAQSALIVEGYSPTIAAALISLASGLLFIGSVVVGRSIDKWGVRIIAPLVVMIYVCAFLSMMLASYGVLLVILSIIAYGFGANSVLLVPPWVMTHMFGERYVGQFFAWLSACTCLGGSFGATVAGTIFDTTGSYTYVWLGMALIMFVGGIIRGWCSTSKNAYKETE